MAALRQSRRSFLISLTVACAALAGVARYLRPRPTVRKVILDTPLVEIPVDSAIVFSDKQLAILRQGRELHALSLVCTHLGCTLSVTPSGLYCPCHGSRFDREGRVEKGPATMPLRRLEVEVREERLIVTEMRG